jgi:uncharacterized protein (TIRG00374 family)
LLSGWRIREAISIPQLIEVSIITLFVNQTVPSAGISGNTFFFTFLRNKKVGVASIFSVIVIELITFYAAMEIVVLAVAVGLLFYKVPSSFFFVLAGGFLIYFFFALGIAYLGKKRTVGKLYKKLSGIRWIKRYFEKLRQPIKGINVEEIKNPWASFRENRLTWMKATFFQLCIFATDSFTIFILFRGLGLPITIGQVFIAFILTKIISILPFSPGSLVLYESGMVFFFVSMGVPLGPALMGTLAYRILSFWLPMLLGFVLYRKMQVRNSRQKRGKLRVEG